MAKFEVEMELTGFKLRVRGERNDIPALTESLQQQVAGLLPQIGRIADDRPSPQIVDARVEPAATVGSRTRRTVKSRRAGSTLDGAAVKALDWDHDPRKWGN